MVTQQQSPTRRSLVEHSVLMASPAFLPHIHALRALAVAVVVVFHLWPQWLPGGYVGVDVFFVISGYLITSHLLRSLDTEGTIRLAPFYARRARRLLPLALLVLSVTTAAVFLLVPRAAWPQFAGEIGASALYVVNWTFASGAVDYFAADDLVSPVQHFWSLSVEEQFYLLWPLVLLGVGLALRRRSPRARRRARRTVLIAILVLGAAVSVIWTSVSPASAYFATPTHVWEFAAGGLLAAFGIGSSARREGAFLLLSGVALIIGASVTFGDATPFPGLASSLPVLGAVLVIASAGGRNGIVRRLVQNRSVQYLGTVSYAVYLWHWPLVVLLPYATARDRTTLDSLLILGLTLMLAAASTRFVENPFRFDRRFSAGPARTIVVAVLASALVATAAIVPARISAASSASQLLDTATAVEAAGDESVSCVGAAASELGLDLCPDSHVPIAGYGAAEAEEDTQQGFLASKAATDPFFAMECRTIDGTTVEQCELGSDDPVRTVVLFGDSHANHLLRPIATLAKQLDWKVLLVYLTSCRPVLQTFTTPIQREGDAPCQDWKADVFDHIGSLDVDLIITSGATQGYAAQLDAARIDDIRGAFVETWTPWIDSGHRILAVSDVPPSPDRPVPACVDAAKGEPDPCALARNQVVGPDALLLAAESMADPAVRSLDLYSVLCDDALCHFVVGGLITHRDTNHLTPTFSATLAPYLLAEFEAFDLLDD